MSDPEQAPPDPQAALHYETSVRALTAAQTGTEMGYHNLAAHKRTMAAHKRAEAALFDQLGEHKRAEAALLDQDAALMDELASHVPDMAQAAADLGIMARHHDADKTLWVVQSEQKLNQQRDSDVAAILIEVAALKKEIGEQAAYRERAEKSRAEMARLLANIAAALTDGKGGAA